MFGICDMLNCYFSDINQHLLFMCPWTYTRYAQVGKRQFRITLVVSSSVVTSFSWKTWYVHARPVHRRVSYTSPEVRLVRLYIFSFLLIIWTYTYKPGERGKTFLELLTRREDNEFRGDGKLENCPQRLSMPGPDRSIHSGLGSYVACVSIYVCVSEPICVLSVRI